MSTNLTAKDLDLPLIQIHQSELKIVAAGTAVNVHFSSHLPSAGKSCQFAMAIWKWSATPASLS